MGGILKIFRQNNGNDPNPVQANSTFVEIMKKEYEERRANEEMQKEGEISYYFNYAYKKIRNGMKKEIRRGHMDGLIKIYLLNSVEANEYNNSGILIKTEIAPAIKHMLENQGLKVEIKTDVEPALSGYGAACPAKLFLWLEVKWSVT
jgi:hypothetical protein